MPLPTPNQGESEQDFISRCMGNETVRADYPDQDQRSAVCYSQWRGEKANALKAISRTDDELRVANYIVLFGGRDLEGVGSRNINKDGTKGEYFTDATDLESSYTKTGRIYIDWEHGQDELNTDVVLGYVDWSTTKTDTRGVWVERVLQRRNQYVKWLEGLIKDGLVGNSSEAVASGVQKTNDGQITRWPLKRDTLTVTPMEPRMLTENYIQAYKALGLPVPERQSQDPGGLGTGPEPEAAPEAVQTAVAAGKATEQAESTSQEEPMSEEQTNDAVIEQLEKNALPSDWKLGDLIGYAASKAAEQAAKVAAEEAVKAYRAELAKEPPTDKGGLVVVADEADKKAAVRTWGLGEFCKAIVDQSVDVRPYQSKEQPGFYDVSKALGPKAVSSISAAKAITGMSEAVPADGGLLVGTDMSNTIMGRVYEEAQIIQRVSMAPISGSANGMAFLANAETSRVAGSRWGGVQYYWAAEGAEKTPSAPTFRRVWMELNKLIALVYATDELLADAATLEQYLMDILPRELRVGFQNAIYNGTGAGQPLGILNAPCLVTQAAEAGQAAATIVSENVINMYSRRWAGSTNYVWMINQDVTPQLIQMNLGVGTGGALTYMPPGGLSGSMYGTLFGLPVIPIEQCPTLGTVGDIALCDWREYQAIEKGGIQSASSIHVRFIFDESVFRWVLRVDGTPRWNLPLTPMNSVITQGPFVVLATRA